MNDSQNAILDTFAAGDRDILKKEILPTKADEPLAAVLLKIVIK
jgi:hypothetical protein